MFDQIVLLTAKQGCKFTHFKKYFMLQDRNSKNFSYPGQLGIFLGLTGVGMVLAVILTGVLWSVMTHRPLLAMDSEMTNPAYYTAMMVIQGVTTLALFFLPVIFYAKICYHNSSKFMGTNTTISWKQVIWVVVLLILVFPVGGALAELNRIIPIPKDWAVYFQQKEDARKVQESIFININTFPKYLLSMLIIAILPAIFEEFFFRAGMQNLFTRWFGGPVAAILLTSVIFSLVHLSYYGFLVRFALGVVLGLIYYYSGSIWLSVLLHFLFNGIQVSAMYSAKTTDYVKTKDLEENFPLWAGAIALVVLIIVVIQFKKESIKVQEKFVYKEPDDPDDFHDWIAKNN